MKVKVKLFPNGKMPTYTREGDACLDCYSTISATIMPGARKKIPLGFALELPEGYEAVIRPRSGMSAKGIDSAIGTIDSNYRGEVMACLINNTNSWYEVNAKDRICQLAIRKTETVNFEIVDELSESNRGSAGFGSSGK